MRLDWYDLVRLVSGLALSFVGIYGLWKGELPMYNEWRFIPIRSEPMRGRRALIVSLWELALGLAILIWTFTTL